MSCLVSTGERYDVEHIKASLINYAPMMTEQISVSPSVFSWQGLNNKIQVNLWPVS